MTVIVVMRVITLLLVLATILPLLPIGSWQARVFDFPRLQFAVLLLINAAVILSLYSIYNRPEWIGSAVVSIVLCLWQLSHVTPYTRLQPIELPNADGSTRALTTLVVANLQYDNESPAKVTKQLDSLDCDLMLLIEVNQAWAEALEPLAERYPHQTGEVREEGLGLLLWSKLPLIDPEVRYLVSDDRPSIHTKVKAASGQTFNLVGVHPTPPGLPKDDDDDDDDEGEGRHDSRRRDAELLLVAKGIADEPDKSWMVTGDFNDVAWSHTTRLFKRLSGLLDPRVGRGLYNTYHADHPLFRFPIDHVFFSSDTKIGSMERIQPAGSDHFAIVTSFAFGSKTADAPDPEGNDQEDADEMIEEGQEDAEEEQ